MSAVLSAVWNKMSEKRKNLVHAIRFVYCLKLTQTTRTEIDQAVNNIDFTSTVIILQQITQISQEKNPE